MTSRGLDTRLFFLRLLAAFALGSSLLLAYEYLQPGPTFCAEAGGCDLVRHSRWARLAGIPTPFYGVVAFGAILALSFFSRSERVRRVLTGLALVAALGS